MKVAKKYADGPRACDAAYQRHEHWYKQEYRKMRESNG